MTYYCTLAEARSELMATANTVEDNRLLGYVRQASARLDKLMSGKSNLPYFLPVLAAYKVPMNGKYISSTENSLLLKGLPPLLEISSVSADGSDVTSVVEGFPQGDSPIRKLRITSSGSSWYSYISSSDPAYVLVTGIWGYHSDYANAWAQVDALAAEQDATTGSFTVVDVDGADPYGITPRISQGALVKIGSEFELVTDTDSALNTVTASRHWNGSTAAIHAIAAPVYVWQVEEPIRRIVARQAALMAARRGAFQVETVDGVGVVSYPQDLLTELKDVVQEYWNS